MRGIDAGRWDRLARGRVVDAFRSGAVALLLVACLLHSTPCAAQASAAAPSHLRIVGGLAGLNRTLASRSRSGPASWRGCPVGG